MIPPQELKKKAFPKRMGGYEPLEVDEYIDFLIDKYTELFAQCDEYQTRLRAVATRIGEIQSEEEAIRTLAISTQKQCDNMLEEARADADKIFQEAQKKAQAMISAGERKEKSILLSAKQIAESTLLSISEKADAQIRNTQERADALLLSARTRCAKILNDFKKEINVQRSGLLQIKDVAENYNNILLNMYKEHLSSLASDMPEINIDLDALTESKLLESIMQDIKNDAAHIADKNSNVEYDFQEELNILKKEIENIQNINDDTDYDLSKNDDDDDDEEIQTSDENNTDTDIDTATDNIERTTVFTKVPETKFEEDVKVFSAQAAHNTSDSTDATMVFDKTSINNNADSNEQQEQYQEQYEEEPVAMTYDSDDFQDYEEDYEEDYNPPATVANSKEDRLRDEYNDYAALKSLSNNNNDDDDDYPEESTKKGLFGLFGKKKNKKKNGKPKNNDNYDDDEDIDDIDTEYDIDDDDDYDIDIDDL